MPILYYSPGACSMASHTALEESGMAYEAKPVLLSKGEHKTPDYLKVNPRGKVPALQLDGGQVLTENVAILTYIARSNPASGLLPKDPVEEARCLSLMAYMSNSVHPAFTHVNRPERFTTEEAGHAAIKAKGRETFLTVLQELDGLLAGRQAFVGDGPTVADLYSLVFYGWGKRIELPMQDLTAYTALKDRLTARPAVRRVLERENSNLLTA
jgi:glutathione S-transferase